MRGVKGAAYAPRSGSNLRYRCNGEGYVKVYPQDVKAMQAMGCQLVEVPEPAKSTTTP
jgi:hypothetical protein